MDESTRTAPGADTPSEPTQPAERGHPGYCSWCDGFAVVMTIHVHEQGSGAGGGTYACASCRARHRLIPFVDQSL